VLQTKLIDYVRVYQRFYDMEFCKNLVIDIKNVEWKTHKFYDSITKNYSSNENELSVSYEDVFLKKELDEKIWNILERYILQDMAHMEKWYSGWAGYSLSRFNRYDPSTQMKLHCDHIHTLFDGERKGIPTLTVLGSLNEDYEGGEFMLCGEKIELKTGDVIVFPSNFLYPHEVKPVKSGVRYSFVSWVW